MSTNIWIANAQPRPDVWWFTPRNVESNSVFTLTINAKKITAKAGEKDSSGEVTEVTPSGIVKLFVEKIQTTDISEWREVAATMGVMSGDGLSVTEVDEDGTTLVLTGPSDGKPITITGSVGTSATPRVLVTETRKGVTGQNETQSVRFSGTPNGGTFLLSFSGQATAAIDYDASAGDVESALEALSTIGSGNASVSGVSGDWLVEFTGALARKNVPLLTGDGSLLEGAGIVDVETLTEGVSADAPETDEITMTTPELSGDFAYRWKWVLASGTTYYSGPHLYYPPAFDPGSISVVLFAAVSNPTGVIATYHVSVTQSGTLTLQRYDPSYINEWIDTKDWEYTGFSTPVNEVQQITVSKSSGGTFTLTFQSQTTAAIAYSTTPATLAANIQAALEDLSNIDSGDVAIAYASSTPDADLFTATFGGSYAYQDVDEMTADASGLVGTAILIATQDVAVADVNEVQTISIPDNPSGGTFQVQFGSSTSGPVAYNASAATLQSALEATPSIGSGNVSVGGASPSWAVTFVGSLAAADQPSMVGLGTGLTISGFHGIKLSRIVKSWRAGTWDRDTLTFTSPTALSGVSAGDAACVHVGAGASGYYGAATYLARVVDCDSTTVTLSADTIEGSPPADDTDALLLIVQAPTGPHHYDEPDNWSAGAVPVDGDTIVFEALSVGCLYHLNHATVTPASIVVRANYTGEIGLARHNGDYLEYRQTYLRLCDSADSATTTIDVGRGNGSGSGRVKIDTGASQTVLKVFRTGSQAETNVPALLWKGTHASNVVEVQRGSVGIAFYYDESAAVASLTIGWDTDQQRDADVVVGPGCSSITTIVKTGGVLALSTSAGTLSQEGGETLFLAGTVTTITLVEGTFRYYSTGGYATLNIYNAEADFSPSDSPITGGATTLYSAKGSLLDPNERITFTSPPALRFRTRLSTQEGGTIDLGNDISLQRS